MIALVLAGGQSSRMGQDKALLAWQGQPMLQRVCWAAATCCSQVVILSPWPERYRAAIAPPLQSAQPYHWLQEAQPGRGPLVALADGLEQLQQWQWTHCDKPEWLLLLACDLPQLDPGWLQTWARQLPQYPLTTLAVVPQRQTAKGIHWEPLCGFYRLTVGRSLTEFLANGGRSFQAWLDRIPVEPILLSSADYSMLHNCNRPEDMVIGKPLNKPDRLYG